MSRGLDSCNHEFVYRVLRPDESPYNKIVCKDARSTRAISEHVEDGLQNPSRFISTSASLCKALKWIDKSYSHTPSKYSSPDRRNTIVKIDIKLIKQNYPTLANSAYNFTDSRVRSIFLNNDVQHGYARGYQEVVFDTSIPLEAISDIYVVGKGWIGSGQAPAPAVLISPVNTSLIAANTPNNVIPSIPPVPFKPTPSTQSQSTACSIQVDAIRGDTGRAGVKRKLTFEETEPPLKYACTGVQVGAMLLKLFIHKLLLT